jgi:hypothetical protein
MASDYFLIPRDSKPIGYAALVARHSLRVMPHHRWSFLATKGERRELDGRIVLRLANYDPDQMSDVGHALFALKHDGLSLSILFELFATVDRSQFEAELIAELGTRPAGQYHRRLWYLYEWLTDRHLPTEGSTSVRYVNLVESRDYFTGLGTNSSRHRVINNLPGNRAFCPLVRRTKHLDARSTAELRGEIDKLVSDFDRELIERALAFIYTKETRSSFAIEREIPNATRAERFIDVLRRVSALGELDEQVLTEIQNRIVDPRFAEDGFRTTQNYVGESLGLHRQRIHFVAPRPDSVRSLMTGLLEALSTHSGQVSDAVVWAAIISFGFVFIHPFEDGNGRLHRFLIHYVLAREAVTPPGVLVPVSAVMRAKRAEYDRVLEEFSRPLMSLIDYDLHADGSLTVNNDTARYYRYFDATTMAEALYRWLDEAITDELRGELKFLFGLRAAKAAMAEIVDMPDRLMDLFVKLVVSNGGSLAKRNRDHFIKLTDEEIAALEQAVRANMPPLS